VVGVFRDDVAATGASPRRQDGGVVTNVGGAYVFVRSGNTFVLEASLKPGTAAPDQQFGRAVSINARGDFVAIGAPGAQQVWFFSRASTTWKRAGRAWGSTPPRRQRHHDDRVRRRRDAAPTGVARGLRRDVDPHGDALDARAQSRVDVGQHGATFVLKL